MRPEFVHYWQEGVILNQEERAHKNQITQVMNQGFVYTVAEGSPLNRHVSTTLTRHELEEMMLREDNTPSDLMPFLLATKTKQMTKLPSIYITENHQKLNPLSFSRRQTTMQRFLGSFFSNTWIDLKYYKDLECLCLNTG